ncbi:MAG: hypothetical protein ACRESZ_11315 [Methylococcales bacterium]
MADSLGGATPTARNTELQAPPYLRADTEALVLRRDLNRLQSIEVADDLGPLEVMAGGFEAFEQGFAYDQRQEGTEDVATRKKHNVLRF